MNLEIEIFKETKVCEFLRMKEENYPPYCKRLDNECEDIFEFAGDKYCKRELLYFNKKENLK